MTATEIDSAKMLTVPEVAELLGWSAYTIQKRARLGVLPARKDGGEWRFDPVKIQAHIAKAGGKRK